MDLKEKTVEQEINLLDLVHILLKRKLFIAKVCVVAVIASVGYSLSLQNIYSATTKVLPPQKETAGGLTALLGQGGGLTGLAAAGLGGGTELYQGILKSRSVADAVIRRLDLMKVYQSESIENARIALAGSLKVQASKDGILAITVEDKDPKFAAQLANTLADELGKAMVRLNLSKAGTERSFLERRLEVVKKDLKAAEDELKSYSLQKQIVAVDSQAKASIEGIAKLRAELASKEVQLAVLSSKQTDQSPEVKAVQSSIRSLKTQIYALTGNTGGGAIPAVGEVPKVGLEYSRRMREFKTQEAVYEQLTKQYELAKLNEAKDSSSLQVLDEAVIPVKKTRPVRSRIVILSTLFAFFGSVFIVFVQEYLARLPEKDRKLLQEIKKSAIQIR
ncbi:lipopolysaccharide biosynthesis protein [Geomonas oryzisoli]|uniref:Lipopolysaccharide biosynthesis protein n=1 Tax=Geomonas oryzisoli TaxID=2847992 RepID=A0ABX8J150_9BACT|nr:Wzz/FepE/Etk N-terminal domain-containing protein [Geomonas oryzisoli]QWV91969.1 lipopolysaccharide biosynthesis protein [Geomonas oryzisoli]